MFSLLSYRLKRLNRSVLARLSLLAPKFGSLWSTPVPLLKLEYTAPKRNRTLMIFLPGIDDLAEDFERRGFIHELRRQRIAADAVAVDAHYGYYATRAIFERITDDIIASAHSAGYREIWLVGISLGGFGAASYAARHASHISGIALLAPYLGDKVLIREISEAGGLAGWDPGEVQENDFQRGLWAWFKHHIAGGKPALHVYLGYGKSDMFSQANSMLADILPSGCVFAIAGRHDWRTWKQIWRIFLVHWSRQHS